MGYLLLFSDIAVVVLQNTLQNALGIRVLKTGADVYRFNAYTYVVCVMAFAALAVGRPISLYSLVLGSAFGLLTVLAGVYKIKALATGPMHMTVLITTSSMIIPSLAGVVWFGEPLRIEKLIATVALIVFLFFSLDWGKGSDCSTNGQWLLACVVAFFSMGGIGVLQKIHQSSSHKNELFGFLACSFLLSFAYAWIASRRGTVTIRLERRVIVPVLLSGLFSFTMNYWGLKLSGILPSQIYFPLLNGSAIVLSSLCAVVIFKERISRRQIIGLVGGVVSLVVLCL